mmetsp:Transcript_11996/g.34250  ORF Transcript_11996/g.34250 Transcript_11996/m.34250 type:complete len:388 (-) Transcript_11996:8-1171(-)
MLLEGAVEALALAEATDGVVPGAAEAVRRREEEVGDEDHGPRGLRLIQRADLPEVVLVLAEEVVALHRGGVEVLQPHAPGAVPLQRHEVRLDGLALVVLPGAVAVHDLLHGAHGPPEAAAELGRRCAEDLRLHGARPSLRLLHVRVAAVPLQVFEELLRGLRVVHPQQVHEHVVVHRQAEALGVLVAAGDPREAVGRPQPGGDVVVDERLERGRQDRGLVQREASAAVAPLEERGRLRARRVRDDLRGPPGGGEARAVVGDAGDAPAVALREDAVQEVAHAAPREAAPNLRQRPEDGAHGVLQRQGAALRHLPGAAAQDHLELLEEAHRLHLAEEGGCLHKWDTSEGGQNTDHRHEIAGGASGRACCARTHKGFRVEAPGERIVYLT